MSQIVFCRNPLQWEKNFIELIFLLMSKKYFKEIKEITRILYEKILVKFVINFGKAIRN